MTGGVAIAIDAIVAILLAATVFHCLALEKRLKQLRADEAIMRRTVADLATATGNAERAIATLKQTVSTADASLAERLESAERFAADLSNNVRTGEDIIDRVRQIVETTRRAAAAQAVVGHAAPLPANPKADSQASRNANTRLAAAAIAADRLVERARARQRGEAA
ncbi:MAG: DUF6468 domain-containing protein [Beijerinckiaceae bacterium]